jgi:hypothetical protein
MAVQTKLRFEKFLQWNSKQEIPFTDDDVIGFGDADEIASRDNVELLKHCRIKGDVLDIGTWFVVGSLNYAFKSDAPIPGYPYSFGDPSFYTFKYAKSKRDMGLLVTRNRGSSGSWLLGGIHMTSFTYIPYMIVKMFICNECGVRNPKSGRLISNVMRSDDLKVMNTFWRAQMFSYQTGRLVNVTDLNDDEKQVVVVPWFLKHNPNRYPYWWGRMDNRLE